MGVTAVGFDYEAAKEVNEQMKDDTSADGDMLSCLTCYHNSQPDMCRQPANC